MKNDEAALARSAAPSSGELWSGNNDENAIVLADRVSADAPVRIIHQR